MLKSINNVVMGKKNNEKKSDEGWSIGFSFLNLQAEKWVFVFAYCELPFFAGRGII